MGEAPETESEEEIDTENPQKEKVMYCNFTWLRVFN